MAIKKLLILLSFFGFVTQAWGQAGPAGGVSGPTATSGGGNLNVGTSTIVNGTNGSFLFDNNGILGNQTAVTSVCTGLGAAGGCITTTGTIITTDVSVAHVNNDTIANSEGGGLGTFNSGSAVAITLPQANNGGVFAKGWFEDFTNYGAGVVTFTTSTSTFLTSGTPTTYTLNQNQSVRFTSSTASPGNWDVSGVGAGGLTVGTSPIAGGTTLRVLYDNAGVLGEYTNTQLTALIQLATASLSGALPAWPNNTTTYFRGDGTYPTLNCGALTDSVATCSSAAWSGITGTPTTLSGYGITSPLSLAQGGTAADLSGTGGASQFLRQNTLGASITVVRPACADLSDSGTACTAATGTSGGTLPFLNGTNTWSGVQTFTNIKLTSTGVIFPTSDSTTAINIDKADGTTRIIDVDTTNARVGINKTPGAFDLDVNGAFNAGGAITSGGSISTTAGVLSATASNSGTSDSGVRNSTATALAVERWHVGNNTSIDQFTIDTFVSTSTVGIVNSSTLTNTAGIWLNGSTAGIQFGTNVPSGGTSTNNVAATGTPIVSALSVGSATNPDLVIKTGVLGAGGNAQATATTALTIKGETQNAIFAATTDATSTSTGAVQIAGGVSITKRVFTAGLTASAGLQTGVVCLSSGSELINDSVACLASSARYKHDIEPLDLGLETVLALKPVAFSYNKTGNDKFDDDRNRSMRQLGFIAEQARDVDERLVGFDKDGQVRTFRYENYTAVLTLAIQQQEARIRALEAAR